MLRNTIPRTLLIVLVWLSGIICFSGCELHQRTAPDPNMLVTEQTEWNPVPVQAQNQQGEAISVYVDAMMLNELNEWEQALRKLNLALELNPRFTEAYSLKGDILQDMNNYEDSANAYEQATLLDPWSFKDFFNLGKVCQIIKQWTRAAEAYASACNLDPKHYPAHIGAARCYYELQAYNNSLTFAERAKVLDPDSADPELLLGDLFEVQKNHPQAINAYRRALELEGNNPAVMVSLARAYLRSGRYSSAKELLTDVISMDPANNIVYQYPGFAQLRLKETTEAVRSYRQAVEIDENDWMARKGLGVAYMLVSMKNQNDEKLRALALEQWNISLQIKPQQPKLAQLMKQYSN